MYNLENWYKEELKRIENFYLNELQKHHPDKYKTQKDKKVDFLLDRLKQFLKVRMHDHRTQIIQDLPRTPFHSSLNLKHYSRTWLQKRHLDYAQGMPDGSLPFLATLFFSAEKDLLPVPTNLLRFAYEDDKGQMSTFCLYVEPMTQSWCIAVCHDPFQNPQDLRFEIVHSTKPSTLESLTKIIANQDISIKVLSFINDNFGLDKAFDIEQLTKKTANFNLQCANSQLFIPSTLDYDLWQWSHLDINQYLWKNKAFSPDSLYSRTSKDRASEIETDYKRLLVHPSLLLEKRQNILQEWQDANISYSQGMISGFSAVKHLEADEKLYDIKFNFIYQTNKGNYGSFYFYYDLVNAKCFLAISNNLLQAYKEQHFECIFPLEQIPNDLILEKIIQNSEILELTKYLFVLLPRMQLLGATNRDKLKLRILQLQDDLKYRFGLDSYDNETSSFVQVEKPAQSVDDILPKLSIYEWLSQSVVYMASLMLKLIQMILDFFKSVFCFRTQQHKVLSLS